MGEGHGLEDTCTWKVTDRIGVLIRRLPARMQEEGEGNSSERKVDQDQKWDFGWGKGSLCRSNWCASQCPGLPGLDP